MSIRTISHMGVWGIPPICNLSAGMSDVTNHIRAQLVGFVQYLVYVFLR